MTITLPVFSAAKSQAAECRLHFLWNSFKLHLLYSHPLLYIDYSDAVLRAALCFPLLSKKGL